MLNVFWRWSTLKGKNIFILISSVTIIFFLALYFGEYTGYYKFSDNNKSTLTDEAIKRFEQDLKEGKDVNISNYLEEEKHYNNKASTFGMKLSSLIEKAFNKGMNALFSELEKAIEN